MSPANAIVTIIALNTFPDDNARAQAEQSRSQPPAPLTPLSSAQRGSLFACYMRTCRHSGKRCGPLLPWGGGVIRDRTLPHAD